MAVTEIKAVHVTPENVFRYIARLEKTEEGTLLFSHCCSTDPQIANMQMKAHRRRFNKDDDILMHHGYVSFKANEITPERAREFAIEYMNGKFAGYQYFGSVHVDKENVHFHFVINAVGLDGRKYNGCTESLNELRAWTDTMCERYGLEVTIPKDKGMSYKEYMEKKEDTSWKEEIRKDIDTAVLNADSFEDFLRFMNQQGYFVKHGDNIKHIVFKKAGMERGCRGRKIGAAYTEEAIKDRIKLKEFSFMPGAIQMRRSRRKLTSAQKNLWGLKRRRASLSTVLALWLHEMAGTKEVNFRKVPLAQRRKYKTKYEKQIKELSSQLFFVKKNQITSRNDVNKRLLKLLQKLNAAENWDAKQQIRREMKNYRSLLECLEQIRERRIIPELEDNTKSVKPAEAREAAPDRQIHR